MGLSFEEPLISQLLESVQNMRESTTYQVILRERRIGEAQRFLQLQGGFASVHPT